MLHFAKWKERWFLAQTGFGAPERTALLSRPYDQSLLEMGFKAQALPERATPAAHTGDRCIYTRSLIVTREIQMWSHAASGPLLHVYPLRFALDGNAESVICSIDVYRMTAELCELSRLNNQLRESGDGEAWEKAVHSCRRDYSRAFETGMGLLHEDNWKIVPREAPEKALRFDELCMIGQEKDRLDA